MCVYCYCGDQTWKWNPPWEKPKREEEFYPWDPLLPKPARPRKKIVPWNLQELREYLELLKQIKALEDQIGCECEPSKADHIGVIKKRIAALEKQQLKEKVPLRVRTKNPKKPGPVGRLR